MARDDFGGKRAATTYSEHVPFPFFIVKNFSVCWFEAV